MNAVHRYLFTTVFWMVGMGGVMAEEMGGTSQPQLAAREIEFVNVVTDKTVYLFYQSGPDKGYLKLSPNSHETYRLCDDCQSLNWKISAVLNYHNGRKEKISNRGRVEPGRFAVFYDSKRRNYDVMPLDRWEQQRRGRRR